jgi:nucleotide-binding universal stress UspA family protein
MFDWLVARVLWAVRRAERIERRELREFHRWLQNTNNLVHVSVLLFVPLLMALVTVLSNALTELSFLLFPPLASGTYTLFADPGGRYASPVKFVGGLTAGALSGWAALEVTRFAYGPSTGGGAIGAVSVHPESAALSILLTGGITWALSVEEPSAFSSALLILLIDRADPATYVLSVAVASTLVAGVFVLWRREFYQQRAEYLYDTARGDDHVLVPMRGETAESTAIFGARLAAAHEAGKVVLLGLVDEPEGEDGETELSAATEQATRLARCAERIRTEVGVPCEYVVASGDPVSTTLATAEETNCDLIVAPYEEEHGLLSEYVRGIFDGPIDTVAFRSRAPATQWKRVLVTVARPGDTAHAMIDFASRLAGRSGTVSVCTCINREVERRPAENVLANLAETADSDIETRVARSEIEEFIAANAGNYDLLVLGSSGERSAASRFVSPPTFERIQNVESDVAVVDRGTP